MTRCVDEDLEGAELRECNLDDTRLIGVLMQHAVIDGLVTNLVVNGVEVRLGSIDLFTPMGLGVETVPAARSRGSARRWTRRSTRSRRSAMDRLSSTIGAVCATPTSSRDRRLVDAYCSD